MSRADQIVAELGKFNTSPDEVLKALRAAGYSLDALPVQQTIAQKIAAINEELEQLEIDAQDIGMTGAEHKISEARGSLRSAQTAAEQWTEF